MSPTAFDYHPAPLTARELRPLLGGLLTVRTSSSLWQGTLVSCAHDTAWFVVDDADIMVHLDEIVSVRGA